LLLGVAITAAVTLWWVTGHTHSGVLVRAAADNPDLLAVSGVEPRRVQQLVIAVGSMLAVVAGVINSPALAPAPAPWGRPRPPPSWHCPPPRRTCPTRCWRSRCAGPEPALPTGPRPDEP